MSPKNSWHNANIIRHGFDGNHTKEMSLRFRRRDGSKATTEKGHEWIVEEHFSKVLNYDTGVEWEHTEEVPQKND